MVRSYSDIVYRLLSLDGFDLGIGMLMPFIGKTGEEKDILINSIGPVWTAMKSG